MTLYEIIFRVSEGLDDGLTRKFSSLKMFFWCNREHDIIEIMAKDPEEYARFIKETPRPEGTVDAVADQQCSQIIIKACSCMETKMSVVRLIGDLGILHISPVMAEKGWIYHRIVTFRDLDFEKFMERLEKTGFVVEVLRKAPLDGFIASSLTLNADTLFSGLTEKQVDAILTAHKYGYFRFPRRADVQTIAAKKHVPRTTFSDNLKKAENKLVTGLVPYIQLFSHVPKERRASLKMKVHHKE